MHYRFGPRTVAAFSANVVLGFTLILSLSACGGKEAPPAPPRPVAVVKPAALDALVGEAYPGTVRARVESALSFRVAGKIVERRAEIGMHVDKGTVLAVLDPVDAKLNVEASNAAVKAAEAEARLTQSEYKRHLDLLAKGFVSQSLVDLRHNEAEAAQARLDQAKSQLAVIRNQAGYTTLVADAPGTVTELLSEAGQNVAAGQAVLNFARDGEREVRITVPEGGGVAALRNSPALAVTLWGLPAKRYQGRIREVSASADPQLRTHEARITIVDPDDDIHLGMTASVIVGASAVAGSFQLPLTAVTEINGKPTIWRAQGEPLAAQPVTVEVLQYLERDVIVRGALKPDDQVISAGVHLLIPGMAVKAIDRTAPVGL